jgi:hypothetical protein
MKLTLNRIYAGETYTIGKLYINGIYFCDTLEDKVRDYNKDGDLLDANETKIFGETAIPYGIYEVVLNYSPKFKKVLPRLLNVKHFEGILIHSGNTADHSHGCILLGENKQKGKVLNSKKYVQLLIDEIGKTKGKIFIEIN